MSAEMTTMSPWARSVLSAREKYKASGSLSRPEPTAKGKEKATDSCWANSETSARESRKAPGSPLGISKPSAKGKEKATDIPRGRRAGLGKRKAEDGRLTMLKMATGAKGKERAIG